MIKKLAMQPGEFNSSFLSCEKDIETILRKLFIESRPYSDQLKRLLILNVPDCLDNDSDLYKEKIDISLKELSERGYICTIPKISLKEHEEVKAYIIVSFDNFTMNVTNPEFRDHVITFDILCNTDYWDLGDFRLRPLKIAGYIDGILNNTKLSGIGRLQFLSCKELIINEDLSGYTLVYMTINGSDDKIEREEDNG